MKLPGATERPGPKEINECENAYHHQVYNHFHHKGVSLYTPKQLIYFGVWVRSWQQSNLTQVNSNDFVLVSCDEPDSIRKGAAFLMGVAREKPNCSKSHSSSSSYQTGIYT